MQAANVEVAVRSDDQLGEAPHWDPLTRLLTWVDIHGGRVHRWDPSTGNHTTMALGEEVSFAITRSHGGLIIGTAQTIAAIDTCGERVTICELEHSEGLRCNDAKCDHAGRLWAGTMSRQREPGTAALYRLTPPATLDRVLHHTTISNGLGWNTAGDRFYFIDSPTQRIDLFDFDQLSGAITNRRPLIWIDPRLGMPDGLTVDAEDGIWVCLFGGGAIHRYSARGALDAVVEMPTSNPTSLTFGGPNLDQLFVTSAKHHLSEEQLAHEPLAGSLLTVAAGVAGIPANAFAG
jgi:sugar lactone lactonase YvrE